MVKKMAPKGKLVSGKKAVAAEEKYDKKMGMKALKEMSTSGIAKALKKSEKEMGYSKKPRVKPQKKRGKINLKAGEVY